MAANASQAILVEELRDFRDAIKRVDTALPKRLQQVHKKVAQLIAQRAADKARGLGGVAAKSAGAVKASAGQLSATVKLDGRGAYPFAPGAEFGAAHNVERELPRGTVRGWNQFHEWTGAGRSTGAFFFPSVRASREDARHLYDQLLVELLHSPFPE